jgi:hypothetical protein
MDKQIEIPAEIKRWNWGAFLLAPFWCIRHRLWLWLLLFLFVPFFGFITPFVLGANGNQKAWLKNTHESVEAFLKRQKRWGFAGLAIWIVGLCTLLGYAPYSLNHSEGMKMGLQIANSNKRLTEHFGQSIKKSSFFSGSYEYRVTPKPSTLAVTFEATGSQNTGSMQFQWEKRGKDWVTTEIAFADSEGKTHPVVHSPQIVHSPAINSSFSKKMPYEKTSLENVLNQIIQEKEGYVALSRSKENNDFMHAIAKVSDDGNIVFSVAYSDGYTRWNKKLYQSKNFLQHKEVINLFSLYATGDDSHINLIEWDKLTSLIPKGNNLAEFVFGEDQASVSEKI